ncbi:hypothetical protein, partial [Nostoc sp.]|uniref:hypothetical protein n=1 Tax=Nostoc sp. TaxID=1180 RepID=UPI002FF36DA5
MLIFAGRYNRIVSQNNGIVNQNNGIVSRNNGIVSRNNLIAPACFWIAWQLRTAISNKPLNTVELRDFQRIKYTANKMIIILSRRKRLPTATAFSV